LKIKIVSKRSENLIIQLTDVWESSVRATHFFLSEEAVQTIKTSLPEILREIPNLIIAEDESPIAFMGISHQELEMLFVAPEFRGHGIGKQLITYGIKNFNVNKLTVNEQNPQAIGFYQHLDFETYRRTETDDAGNPYPILYMKKTNAD
jgi:Acetyltransferases